MNHAEMVGLAIVVTEAVVVLLAARWAVKAWRG